MTKVEFPVANLSEVILNDLNNLKLEINSFLLFINNNNYNNNNLFDHLINNYMNQLNLFINENNDYICIEKYSDFESAINNKIIQFNPAADLIPRAKYTK